MSTPAVRHRSLPWLLTLGCVLAGRGAAAAQESAPLQGIVADEQTGQPIASALVTVVGTQLETRTDADGIFELPGVPLGRAFLRVQAAGHPTIVDEVEVTHEQLLFVPLLVPSPGVLAELLVIGRRAEPKGGLMARSAADLVALQIPGMSGLSTLEDRPLSPTRLGLRGRGTFNLSGEPAIVLDGVRISGGVGNAMSVLRQVPAGDVKSIRVLKGPSSAFLYGSADGVIIIETGPGGR